MAAAPIWNPNRAKARASTSCCRWLPRPNRKSGSAPNWTEAKMKKGAARTAPFSFRNFGRLDRVIHLEFDGVGRVLERVHFTHLQFEIGVDEVVGEDTA